MNDLTGKRFGRLVVIKDSGRRSKGGGIIWLCQCDCGNDSDILSTHLTHSGVESCGCLIKEAARKNLEKYKNGKGKLNYKEKTSLSNLDSKLNTNNTSGAKGVSWSKSRKKWIASIWFQGKNRNLGGFENIQDAVSARKEAEEEYFKPILEKYSKEDADK